MLGCRPSPTEPSNGSDDALTYGWECSRPPGRPSQGTPVGACVQHDGRRTTDGRWPLWLRAVAGECRSVGGGRDAGLTPEMDAQVCCCAQPALLGDLFDAQIGVSRSCCARRTRSAVSHCKGGIPTSAANRRVRVRVVTPASRASSPSVKARSSRDRAQSSRGARAATGPVPTDRVVNA